MLNTILMAYIMYGIFLISTFNDSGVSSQSFKTKFEISASNFDSFDRSMMMWAISVVIETPDTNSRLPQFALRSMHLEFSVITFWPLDQ